MEAREHRLVSFVQTQDQIAMELFGNPGAMDSRELRYRQGPLLARTRGTGAEPEEPEPDCRQRQSVSSHRPSNRRKHPLRIVQGSIQIPSTTRVEASALGGGLSYSTFTNSMRTLFPIS